MPQYVAFLRAVNVGRRVVKMDALRGLFEASGFSEVETFIASGNVIFSSRSDDARGLTRRIEQSLQDALGYDVATFLRTDAEVAAIARHEPFTRERIEAGRALNVGLLAGALTPEHLRRLRTLESDIDAFHVSGTELYWLCQGRQSESAFSNAVFEKRVGVRATFRGMSTLERLAAKYPPVASGSSAGRAAGGRRGSAG